MPVFLSEYCDIDYELYWVVFVLLGDSSSASRSGNGGGRHLRRDEGSSGGFSHQLSVQELYSRMPSYGNTEQFPEALVSSPSTFVDSEPLSDGYDSSISSSRLPLRLSEIPIDDAAAYARGLVKHYGEGDTLVVALDSVDIEFERAQFTAIMGPSGSGKSTLMHCMAGLDSVTDGSVFIGDTEISTLNEKQTTSLRRDRLGFIFQSFNLVPTLTAAENITLPLDIAGRSVDRRWFNEITERLGLTPRLKHRPAELSGGQQQRVACARALLAKPDIVFADEPTGNLDSNSSSQVLSILRQSVDHDGQTVVIVTHDPAAAAYADRVVFLADGRIVNEVFNPTIEDIISVMVNIEEE